jgi:hypothetical protein
MNNDDDLFYIAHVILITTMLSWIARLTVSIIGGVFRGKVTKVNLADKNIRLLQNFLGSLFHNLQNRFPDEKYNQTLAGLLLFFEGLDPFVGTKFSREFIEPSSLIR